MAKPTPEDRTVPKDRIVPAAPAAGESRLPAVRPTAPSPQEVAARPRRHVWVWAVGLLLAGGTGIGLWFQPWLAPPVQVAVETMTPAPVTRLLAVNGRIAALQSIDVRALVSGTLVDLSVSEGDSIGQGAEIARIDAAAQQAMLRQAVAGLDAALVAQGQAEDALTRTEALGGNVARSALDVATRSAQSAAQEVARTTALVEQAQVQLGLYTIHAPITGTVLAIEVARGQSIDPSTLMMTIADLDQLVVETNVDEAYATQIHPDLPAVMQLAGESSQRPGHISRVSQQVDPATGGLAVELRFRDAVSAPIGLTVTINILVEQRDAALTIPRAAILTDGGTVSVFAVVDGIARRRPVSVIDWPAERLIVTEGLASGEIIILDASGLTDGQSVSPAVP